MSYATEVGCIPLGGQIPQPGRESDKWEASKVDEVELQMV